MRVVELCDEIWKLLSDFLTKIKCGFMNSLSFPLPFTSVTIINIIEMK